MKILRCCQIAVVKVSELTELIKQALDNDARARYSSFHLSEVLKL